MPYVYWATVIGNHDGDTLTVDVDQGFNEWHRNLHLRLARIDAPEIRKADPAGAVSRDYLSRLLPPGTTIIVQTTERNPTDAYPDRWDGEAVLHGVNISDAMVTAGMARYRKFP